MADILGVGLWYLLVIFYDKAEWLTNQESGYSYLYSDPKYLRYVIVFSLSTLIKYAMITSTQHL